MKGAQTDQASSAASQLCVSRDKIGHIRSCPYCVYVFSGVHLCTVSSFAWIGFSWANGVLK